MNAKTEPQSHSSVSLALLLGLIGSFRYGTRLATNSVISWLVLINVLAFLMSSFEVYAWWEENMFIGFTFAALFWIVDQLWIPKEPLEKKSVIEKIKQVITFCGRFLLFAIPIYFSIPIFTEKINEEKIDEIVFEKNNVEYNRVVPKVIESIGNKISQIQSDLRAEEIKMSDVQTKLKKKQPVKVRESEVVVAGGKVETRFVFKDRCGGNSDCGVLSRQEEGIVTKIKKLNSDIEKYRQEIDGYRTKLYRKDDVAMAVKALSNNPICIELQCKFYIGQQGREITLNSLREKHGLDIQLLVHLFGHKLLKNELLSIAVALAIFLTFVFLKLKTPDAAVNYYNEENQKKYAKYLSGEFDIYLPVAEKGRGNSPKDFDSFDAWYAEYQKNKDDFEDYGAYLAGANDDELKLQGSPRDSGNPMSFNAFIKWRENAEKEKPVRDVFEKYTKSYFDVYLSGDKKSTSKTPLDQNDFAQWYEDFINNKFLHEQYRNYLAGNYKKYFHKSDKPGFDLLFSYTDFQKWYGEFNADGAKWERYALYLTGHFDEYLPQNHRATSVGVTFFNIDEFTRWYSEHQDSPELSEQYKKYLCGVYDAYFLVQFKSNATGALSRDDFSQWHSDYLSNKGEWDEYSQYLQGKYNCYMEAGLRSDKHPMNFERFKQWFDDFNQNNPQYQHYKKYLAGSFNFYLGAERQPDAPGMMAFDEFQGWFAEFEPLFIEFQKYKAGGFDDLLLQLGENIQNKAKSIESFSKWWHQDYNLAKKDKEFKALIDKESKNKGDIKKSEEMLASIDDKLKAYEFSITDKQSKADCLLSEIVEWRKMLESREQELVKLQEETRTLSLLGKLTEFAEKKDSVVGYSLKDNIALALQTEQDISRNCQKINDIKYKILELEKEKAEYVKGNAEFQVQLDNNSQSTQKLDTATINIIMQRINDNLLEIERRDEIIKANKSEINKLEQENTGSFDRLNDLQVRVKKQRESTIASLVSIESLTMEETLRVEKFIAGQEVTLRIATEWNGDLEKKRIGNHEVADEFHSLHQKVKTTERELTMLKTNIKYSQEMQERLSGEKMRIENYLKLLNAEASSIASDISISRLAMAAISAE